MSDDFNEKELVLSRDDELSMRLLRFAELFMNSALPISMQDIRQTFYSGLSDDAADKAFSRDRAQLTLWCGITLKKSSLSEDKRFSSWQVDPASFVEDSSLSDEDRLLINVFCLPLLEDKSFPWQNELRHALNKINPLFSEPSAIFLPSESPTQNKLLTTLISAFSRLHPVEIEYQKNNGALVKRILSPFGFFPLRGEIYVVAPLYNDRDFRPHTYKVSNMRRVIEKEKLSFEIPLDFDVRDFVKLPFQIGEYLCSARFYVPPEQEHEFRQATMGRGVFSNDENGLVFTADCSSFEDAASWAISQGVVPLSPPELVKATQAMLKEVCS